MWKDSEKYSKSEDVTGSIGLAENRRKILLIGMQRRTSTIYANLIS
jgi:hypothetical protein